MGAEQPPADPQGPDRQARLLTASLLVGIAVGVVTLIGVLATLLESLS